MGDGQVIASGAIWAPEMLNEQVLVAPRVVAVQVTGVLPRPKLLPLAGAQPIHVPPLTVGSA